MSFPFITITASLPFVDETGAPFTGELTVTPTSPFRLPNGGQALAKPITRPLVAGLLKAPLTLANPALTSPTGIGYTFEVHDLAGNKATWANVLISPDEAGTFDLAQLNTGQFIAGVPVTVLSVAGGTSNTMVTLQTGAGSVSQYQAVALVGGLAVTANSSDATQVGTVVGVAAQSVGPHSSLEVQTSGAVTCAGWNFTNGPVFLSPTGSLTQNVPGSGFLQVLGIATAPQTVLLSLQEADLFPSS